MTKHSRVTTVLACLLAAPFSAQAQDIPALATETAPETAAAPQPETACALHVWPGSNLRSTYYGWLHGGIVDGAVNGRDGYKKLPASPMDTERQKDILSGIDIAKALGLNGYSLTIHPDALDSRTLRGTPGSWLAASGGAAPAACQAELAIDDVFFQEDVFSGKYLKVIYRFKRFDGAQTPSRSFGQIMAIKLLAFPPAQGTDPAPAMKELGAALARSVEDFGSALNAPPKKKK